MYGIRSRIYETASVELNEHIRGTFSKISFSSGLAKECCKNDVFTRVGSRLEDYSPADFIPLILQWLFPNIRRPPRKQCCQCLPGRFGFLLRVATGNILREMLTREQVRTLLCISGRIVATLATNSA